MGRSYPEDEQLWVVGLVGGEQQVVAGPLQVQAAAVRHATRRGVLQPHNHRAMRVSGGLLLLLLSWW